MDRGFLAQDYYRKAKLMLPLAGGRRETFSFDTYSWTEHQSRKWGQWAKDLGQLVRIFNSRGFRLDPKAQ
jgi:hypothetical protein